VVQPALHPPRLIKRVLQHVLLQQQRVSQVPLFVLLLLEQVSQVPMLVLHQLERFSQAPLSVLFQLERVCQVQQPVLPGAAGQPSAEAGVSAAAAGQPVAAAVIPTAAVGQPKAAAGVPIAAAGQPCSAGVALTAAAAQPCATSGAQKAIVGQHAAINTGVGFRAPGAGVFAPQAGGVQSRASAHVASAEPSGHALHRPNLLFHGSGHPTASLHLPLSSHGPGVQEPPAFLFAAEALDTGSILPGHTSSAPRGTLLNMPSQQVLPSPAASSSFMPSTQVGEEEEAASKGFTGVTKKNGKNEWVARIVLDRTSNSLIVMSSPFQFEVAAARSIAAASHVMVVDNPTRGDLIPLTDGDGANLQGCTAQQCELMVPQKFWHEWEQ
ncbi:unnamed protein product, partial [Closterium sp. Naga37s-1]